jgi:hypothetical protein
LRFAVLRSAALQPWVTPSLTSRIRFTENKGNARMVAEPRMSPYSRFHSTSHRLGRKQPAPNGVLWDCPSNTRHPPSGMMGQGKIPLFMPNAARNDQ